MKADTAVFLVTVHGMPVNEAAERCDISPVYVYAMKTVRESGNVSLYSAVLRGDAPILNSAKQVENAAAAIVALNKCSGLERELIRLATGFTADPVTMLLNLSPGQLVATSNMLGLDWVWDWMIAAAMPASESVNVA